MRGVRLLALGTGCTMHHSARDSKRRQPDVPTDLVMTVKSILRGGPIEYRTQLSECPCRNVMGFEKECPNRNVFLSLCRSIHTGQCTYGAYIYTSVPPTNVTDEWPNGMFRTSPAEHGTYCRHMTTLNALGAALINRFGHFRTLNIVNVGG